MWTLDSGLAVPAWRHAQAGAVALSFSTRQGGVSRPPYDTLNLGRSTADAPEAVAENRRRYLQQLGVMAHQLVTVGQVHGAEVAVAQAPGFHPGRDAVATRTRGLMLAVSGADCLPILFVAEGSRGPAVAAAHAGWRGTAAGIPRATLAAICDLADADPARVRIHLGPCIRACCYEVGPEVVARFEPGDVRRAEGRSYLDVPGAARRQLMAAGVAPEAIEDTGACTACEPHWYFSHRRDRGLTGRHWGVVGLSAPPA